MKGRETNGSSRCWGCLLRGLAFIGIGEAQQGKTELLWYGQAAFKITTPGGKVIVVDPWITGGTKVPPSSRISARSARSTPSW